jgi:Domain of unknown function (DUF5658)
MKIALALLCAFEVLDGLLTRWAVSGGIVREANPFLANAVATWGYVALKIAGAAACAALLWLVHRRFPRIASFSATSVVAFYGLVIIWNVNTILHP